MILRMIMRKTLILCATAAILGGFVAVLLRIDNRPTVDPQMVAQEPAAYAPNQGSPGTPPVIAGPSVPLAEAALQDLTPEERVNVTVYQNVNRGVVNINTKSVQTDRSMLFEMPFEVREGEGSGSVIDRNGHILTNFHVVDGAREIQATLFDGHAYRARLVGVDAETDMAVLKIEAPSDSLFPVPLGSSSNLLVGQRVLAIGNPFGLERTLTTGIISSLDRSLPARRTQRTIKSIIQIDAAINPGNSGGPLLDSRGLMIGMNTAIASKTGENTGVGFAIPVNTIARVLPQLITTGHFSRPESGVGPLLSTDHGLLIATVVPGGPAEKAGLKGIKVEVREIRQGPFIRPYQTRDISAADIIMAVDGKPVRARDDYFSIIENKRPGETITLTILRGGRQVQVPLKLEAGE
jgi:S1-C subfamily serine protease